MKICLSIYLFFLLSSAGCKNSTRKTIYIPKDTSYYEGDTISGDSVIIRNGDTIIKDLGVNPNWHPDPPR